MCQAHPNLRTFTAPRIVCPLWLSLLMGSSISILHIGSRKVSSHSCAVQNPLTSAYARATTRLCDRPFNTLDFVIGSVNTAPGFRRSGIAQPACCSEGRRWGGVTRGSVARLFQFQDAFGHQFDRLAQALGVHHDVAAGHIAIGAVVQQPLERVVRHVEALGDGDERAP